MSIDKGIELIQIILDNQGNKEFSYLFENETPLFDSILIKPLKKRHIICENIEDKGTRDSDIRFEREERYLFPYVENIRYENEFTNKGYFKKWYLTQIPVRFSLENCHHLFENIPFEIRKERNHYFNHNTYDEGSFVNVHLSKEKREGERLSLGYKDLDDQSFYEFRKLLFEGDFLIVCKFNRLSKFLFLGAKTDDFRGVPIHIDRSIIFLEDQNKVKHSTSFSIENIKEVEVSPEIPHPKQWLISGAPGTGKSFHLKTESESYFKVENIHRVTFHPNYTYGQFIGTFKPLETQGDNVSYGFQIGTFTKVLIKSLENPKENFVLIIEELNRGNANEIFGDLIQIIERDKNGNSVYTIEPSQDLLNYLSINHPNLPNKLYIPNNLYIWATMNHSDQHTFPIDSAFFRRWKNYHIGIDHQEDNVNHYRVILPGTNTSILWNDIRKKINYELSLLPFIKEDQLLGPHFMKKEIISSEEFFFDVIVYLKEYVLKEFSSHLFLHSHTSQIQKEYQNGGKIFRFNL